MNAKQEVQIVDVLIAINTKLGRIADALESKWQPTMVNGIPTDPHTSYATGTIGRAIREDTQSVTAGELERMFQSAG